MKYHKSGDTKRCVLCGKTILRVYDCSQMNWDKKRFCSKSCMATSTTKGQQRRWKGGRVNAGNGYIYLFTPHHPSVTKSGYVMEHRLVMEKILGRFMKDEEDVHHRNGNRADNRPENLELMSRSEHARLHAVKTQFWKHSKYCKRRTVRA